MLDMTPRQAAACLLVAKLRVMGDVPGHEFHGNQWTAGGGAEHEIGAVTSIGRVITKPVATREELFNRSHELLGIRHNGINAFRFSKGTITWSGRPSKEDIKAVEDRYGIGLKHETYRAIDGVRYSFDPRSLSRHTETPVHAAADAHLKPMHLAVMYAFLMGRKALKGSLRAAGDVEGHEFHGNQWTIGGVALSPREEKIAKKYGDIGPYKVQRVIGDDSRPRSIAESLKREANVLHWDVQQMPPGRASTLEMQKRLDGLHEHIKLVEPKITRHLTASIDASAAVKAVRTGLLKALPPVLLKTLVAGGHAGMEMLRPRLKAAEFDESLHPRDEHGRWTVYYHGTSEDVISSIMESGLKPGSGVRKVFITSDIGEAKSFAAGHKRGALLEIRIPHGTVLEKMAYSQAGYVGTIRPEWLRVHSTVKDNPELTGPTKVWKTLASVWPGKAAQSYPTCSCGHHRALHQMIGGCVDCSCDKDFDQATQEVLRTLKPQEPGKPHSSEGPFHLAFNVDSPEAIAWAEEHAGELAKDISETTEQRIKDAVAKALEGDGIEDAYDDILDAVGDEERAELIARTEVMDAANEGLSQSWDQAREEGLLPDDTMKEWIATSGACDECEEMNGEQVALDEDFSIGDDPPAHPHCRCTMGLAFGGN